MQLEERKRPERKGGQWLVLAASAMWGTTGTAQAFAPKGAEPAVVGAVRLAVGGAALLALALSRGSLRGHKRWPALATLFAAVSMSLYQIAFFNAVARTGVAVGTVVAIGSTPILAGALGWLVRGERPSLRWMAATALAILGCAFLVAHGSSIAVDALGVLLALGAGGAYATYAVVSKRLLEEVPPDAAVAVVFCLGALFLSPVLLTANLEWLTKLRGLFVALHLGLVATAAAYMLFARGLTAVPVATAVTLSLAEPLTAAILSVVVLGERLTAPAMFGIGLVFGGLALLSLGRKA
jgi:DME family drug/metabolite transporter